VLDLGLKIGVLDSGLLDAITDVAGVEVGHSTIVRGNDIRTSVTAILPHAGNLYHERVPAAVSSATAMESSPPRRKSRRWVKSRLPFS
jgi:L-aminopeptidase/D-esterase-like protein